MLIDPKHYGIVEMGFTGAVVLGFALWQLWSLRREPADEPRDDSAEGAGHAVGEHRLDDR